MTTGRSVGTPSSAERSTPSRSWARIGLAWLMTIGIDLFFHAGVFVGVFDQSREPALLSDEVLFRRIPFAYAALLLGTIALAWILDRARVSREGARQIGTVAGVIVGIVGYGGLWTAIDLTGLLVLVGVVVLAVQGAAAASVLTAALDTRKLSIRVGATFVVLFALGQVAANLLG